MNKSAHFYVNYNNIVVLNGYLDVIKQSLIRCGFTCDEIVSLDGMNKKDLYIFPMGRDAFKFYHQGYKNFILWQQGATADESYMRHKSKLRYNILNYMDCFAMKKAKMIFFVSQYMKEYYENLSGINFSEKTYIMPCFNETLDEDFIEKKDYLKKNFAYVGSLDLWQCFDETAKLYKEIENRYPDAYFKVLTFSVEKAIEKIKALGIKNYEVKCVKKENVKNELKDIVYGFIIRKDSIVNRVATPTKLSSYMSAGVIPIFSSVLDDFKKASGNMKYAISLEDWKDTSELMKTINLPIDKDELKKEYEYLFNTYYGTQNHVNRISEMMKGIFNE